ncbi:MAG: hypothetical protein COV55_01955 [Candidatus Komeilibacteria bacterium CG11_big_fil_rev_8_21_14_0_20_36_20]|uniref:Uncharacterized protein n=1 Tax=Candidatus Komeilibacteria bacterium CG11_big_fil_rev_8_21_14_0_20_36_20 TaxID=1974477 RepID=A0A2H0ND86_9BACT|nr:MAG: hypothetical protein COV55_01955 [Candidatus Komeilibacteria bacterium CG11_big_fil_rev_8_21_14_0_20_36_20]PIR81561.1 MAG: hypothetical protein COU21_02765 [Candidatus Komeilibacteria bacterium CG10_big_fil_rev_8_21_14_0_10_36_65]PJC55399.1 MAG: hypothetical protein CO027_02065 [Candidatus Komeilibacteria bacterium CG_4_9_14_0_2_um_filter_36_13]
MLNKFGNLHLLILIGAVAVCSLLLIQQNVLAAWQPPSSQPGGTNLDGVVFNPLTQDLDLGGKKITGSSKIIIDPNNGIYSKGIKGVWGVANNPATDLAGYFVGKVNVVGDFCLDSDCIASWADVGSGSSLWTEGAGTNIYYDPLTDNGYVGIDTDDPEALLSLGVGWAPVKLAIYDDGTGTNMYGFGIAGDQFLIQADGSANFSFINEDSGAEVVTIQAADGKTGIGITTPNKLLHLYDTSENAEMDIQSVVGAGNHWGIYQESSNKDLRFWHSDDRVVFTDGGKVGVNTTAPDGYVDVYTDSTAGGIKAFKAYVANSGYGVYSTALKGSGSDNAIGIKGDGDEVGVWGRSLNNGDFARGVWGSVEGDSGYGVYGYSDGDGSVGVYGENVNYVGVRGFGDVGVHGVASDKTPVSWGGNPLAGLFQGNVQMWGNVAIGTDSTADPVVKLEVKADDNQAGIYAYAGDNTTTHTYDGYGATVAGIYGKSGANTVVNGFNYGVYGKADNPDVGTSVGVAGTSYGSGSSYAGYFRGTVKVFPNGSDTGQLFVSGKTTLYNDLEIYAYETPGNYNYLSIDHTAYNDGAPPAGDCDSNTKKGRIIFDYDDLRLYVCTGINNGWGYVDLITGGGGGG